MATKTHSECREGSSWRRWRAGLILSFLCLLASDWGHCFADSKLLIAFSSYRERPRHPKVYFYEHDGVSVGKVIGSIDAVNQRSDYRPALSHDGALCAFASELENQTGRIQLWDVKEKKLIELPKLNDSPNAQQAPTLSADGRLLGFAAWNRPGAGPRWQVLLYDTAGKKPLDVPGLNEPIADQRRPALSGDGRFLAYTTNSRAGVGLSDVFLYSIADKSVLTLPELNSKHADSEPTLSADGKVIAFVSDRPGGVGGRDIYLFDRVSMKFLDLPDLNSVA